jgi:hypothetical protein
LSSSQQDQTTGKSKHKPSAEEKVLAGILDYVVGHTVSNKTPTYVQRTLLMVMSGVVTQVRKNIAHSKIQETDNNGVLVEKCIYRLSIFRL